MSILGITNYYQTLEIIEDKIGKDSIAALRQSSHAVDSFLEKLYKMSSELSLNERIYNFLHTNIEDIRYLNLLARDIMLDLRKYTILNDFIGDIYVYSKINNVIVSPTGMYFPEIFYKSIYANAYNKISFDEWAVSLEKPCFRNFTDIMINVSLNDIAEKILFKDSLPNNRENLGCIMVFMNKEQYLDVFSWILKGYNGGYCILNENLDIIISDNLQMYGSLPISNLSSESGAVKISTPQGKALMVHTSSAYNNWKYVSIIPYDAFTKEIVSLKLSTIIVITIFIILAFIVSLFAANKNYKPIKNIIDFIRTTYDYKVSERDDYKLISNILQYAHKELKLNREILESYIPVIRQSHLTRLLKESRAVDKSQSNSFNTFLDIDLDFSISAVALFNIKRLEKREDAHTEKELYKIALRTAIGELAKNNHTLYTVELDNDNIACIYGSNDKNVSEFQKKLLLLIMELKNCLEKKHNIVLYVGIGNAYKGYKDLSKSYEEADEALNYGILMNEDIVCFDEILKNSSLFTFPIQRELQLINYMKAGKQEEALELINNLYNQNYLNKELTYEMMKFFIYDLYCSIIKVVEELNLEQSDLIVDSIKELDVHNMGLKDMSFFLLDIKTKVIWVCKEVNKQRENRSNELRNNIIKYVDENFLDNQLSLERIADQFNITPQYLSRLFKEYFNMNYVDYVNIKRVNKAKEYLLKGMKVKDVAFKSGFNNIGTFINVFKKHTGFTPGEFKQSNMKQPTV